MTPHGPEEYRGYTISLENDVNLLPQDSILLVEDTENNRRYDGQKIGAIYPDEEGSISSNGIPVAWIEMEGGMTIKVQSKEVDLSESTVDFGAAGPTITLLDLGPSDFDDPEL